MKYEMIFGDERLFDGAPECATHATKGGGFYYVDSGIVKFISNMFFGARDVCGLAGYLVAERRIIKEPKRWTWEDKKAGRLPEVGCKCVGILSEAIKRVVHVNKHIVAVENEKTLNVCNFTHEEFFRNHKPIETPAEKAQRLEDEFVESTCRQNEPHSTLYSDGVRAAYRKLKGGE